MADVRVVRALYRTLLRWARAAQDAPFNLRTADVVACVPTVAKAPQALLDGSGAPQLRDLVRWSFRGGSGLHGEEAGAALDRALDAVRRLHSDYSAALARMRSLRADRADREGVAFHVGDVFTHRKFGYRGVIYGWDRRCERDDEWVAAMSVNPDQAFYHVLPSEEDCVRLFGGVRISKYVAADNIEILSGGRVLHRALESYFSGYSPALGRYVPTRKLQFEYPDEYDSHDVEPCSQDSNLLLHDDPEPEGREAGDGLESLAGVSPP